MTRNARMMILLGCLAVLYASMAWFSYEVLSIATGGETRSEVITKDLTVKLEGAILLMWAVLLVVGISLVLLVLAMFRLENRRVAFVSAVTHELRTPLTSFTLNADMLVSDMVPEEKKPEYYRRILQESYRLQHLVDNVLTFAQIDQKARTGNYITQPCEKLFQTLESDIRTPLEKAGFRVMYAVSPQARVTPICTDERKLAHILGNLVTNTIKYASQVESPQVSVTIQTDTQKVIVRFKDNGAGIPRAERKLIFEPFSRGGGAGKSGKGGVGLGLALARSLARSLGGDLVLESSQLQGASFVLTLPIGYPDDVTAAEI